MTGLNLSNNPFAVTTPEDMSAEDTCSLFVDVLPDFPQILSTGHAFLHGPRGSGKSMIFRYLRPDCQCIASGISIRELPFFAIYIPLKKTDFSIAEIRRLEGKHASSALNSHLLTMHFTEIICEALRNTPFPEQADEALDAVRDVIRGVFVKLLRQWGWQGECPQVDALTSVANAFEAMRNTCKAIYAGLKVYLQRLSFSSDIIPYDGPLTDYIDFLFPLLEALRSLPFMPQAPIYLLLDDADRLSEIQTQALNSWVDTRTSGTVSLKISTQRQYKTLYTFSRTRIDTPHDYSEIDISTIYTTSFKDKYRTRVAAIVKKRLDLAGICVTAEEFFPEDKEQEDAIRRIGETLRRRHQEGEGRGYRASDDVLRYARPEYITALAGTSKSASSYSYAGFEQLVHVSSGTVRFFLEPAAKMFSEATTKAQERSVKSIPPGIQNSVLRAMANAFLFDELDKESADRSGDAPPAEDLMKLANLIEALGGLFHQCLLCKRAERRVFSIAFSDTPTDEIINVLKLGVRYGYLQESTIGKKDSKSAGRTRLYILSRRLAPAFNLDPTGFAGYFFVTSALITEALSTPRSLLRRVAQSGIEDEIDPSQLTLF